MMTAPTRESFDDIRHAFLGAVVIVFVLAGLISCTTLTPGEKSSDVAKIKPEEATVSFHKDIKPILEGVCLHCHNGHVAAGDLDLRTRALAFRRSSNGPFIVPGYPERSKIFNMIRLEDTEAGAMPPTGHGLSKDEIGLIKGWIAQGAVWPDDASGSLSASSDMSWRSH